MEGFLNRYRSITVLLLVIFAQLILVAVGAKTKQDVRLIRVWSVTAVSPVARFLEGIRGGGLGFFRHYVLLHDAETENRRLREENGRLKLDNIFLKNELNRADRAKALELFQSRTASKAVAATIIMMGPGSNSKEVFVDRGTTSGIMRGMAVVTPDGIVGIVRAAYPTASEVLLATDSDFAAGVISQKTQARGTLKGEGTTVCKVDYVPTEDKVEVGDWFFTSGDDRVFPSGFPVGIVKSVHASQPFQEIVVEPVGLKRGLEDVLILIEAVHQDIPTTPMNNQPIYIAPPAPLSGAPQTELPTSTAGTEADKLRSIYKSVGESQNFTYGGDASGRTPDFTKMPVGANGQVTGATKPAPPPATGASPALGTPGQSNPNPAPAAVPPSANPQPPTVRRSNQSAGAPGGPGGPPHQ